MSRRWMIVGIAIGLIAGIILTVKLNIEPVTKAAEKKAEQIEVKGEIDLQNAFINVADKVGPAVVAISTERTQKIKGFPERRFSFRGPSDNDFFDREDPFEKFFEDFFGGFPEREFKQQGLGSGFIIDEEGHILTNHHVVAEADKITVSLSDGRSFDGKVKGSDPRSDLAVVKIEAKKLPVVKLGNSGNVKTGEWVVALGNPFGHILRSPNPTVTVGVVSALHRQIPSGGNQSLHLDMIQTDAAINPGNSGGPLCNINGEVIGINVAIFSTSGGYQGVGFAIPINVAKDVLADLIEGKSISYGWLGVQAQEITDDLAEYFNLSDKEGVLIAKVLEGSPAKKAGIKEGDIIIEFGGEKLKDTYDLVRKVGRTKPGTTVDVKFIRDRMQRVIQVKIDRKPSEEEELETGKIVPEEKESNSWRGIKVANITDEIAGQLGTKDKKGVVIVEIDSQSPFYMMGMRRGDIIREINRNIIKDANDFNKITKEARDKVLIRSDKGYFIVEEK